jgi:hypothetical protein
MKGQTEKAKEIRLSKRRCPVHGIGMSQLGLFDEYSVIGCNRSDCNQRFFSKDLGEDLNGLKEYSELILGMKQLNDEWSSDWYELRKKEMPDSVCLDILNGIRNPDGTLKEDL